MDKKAGNIKEYYTVDLLHIVKTLWRRAWVIVLTGLMAGAIGFSVSAFLIAPEYSSSIMLYVNNSSFSLGNTSFSISSSEISAAQSLVKTYGVLLENRTTLERVIEKSGTTHTCEDLSEMITASSANGTEVMKVTVTAKDPYEAAMIANCIAEVLPVRVAEIVDGASMEVVDSAVARLEKISPSIRSHTALGVILGVLFSIIGLVIAAMLDDTIHDEEYVLRMYDYPILAKIPNLLNSGAKQHRYYSQRSQRSETDRR